MQAGLPVVTQGRASRVQKCRILRKIRVNRSRQNIIEFNALTSCQLKQIVDRFLA